MARLLAALAIALVLTGCGSGGDSSTTAQDQPSTPSFPTCKSLVGQPLSEAWDASAQEITCIDSGTSQVPAGSQSSGCYPGGKYDKKTPVISFSGDDGFYFGRTGKELHYKAGTPSMTQMSNVVGC